MDRQEAARYLGISLRTLDRIVATGKLTKGRRHKKTRPVVTFLDDELEALRLEIENRQRTKTADLGLRPQPKDTVAFRIDPYYSRLLSENADRAGRSVGEEARRIVIRSLECDASNLITEEIRKLRESLGATFYAFLTLKLGATPEEARRFVDVTILGK